MHSQNGLNCSSHRVLIFILRWLSGFHPRPQPLKAEGGIIHLGSLLPHRPTTLLLRFQVPEDLNEGFWPLVRLVATGDILNTDTRGYADVSDVSLEVTLQPPNQKPPTAIIDALSKLTLYEMQEKAREALEDGNVEEATRKLEFLATRLFERGEDQLARQTLTEVEQVKRTSTLSKEGGKTIKYQTRALISTEGENTMKLLFSDNQENAPDSS